MDVKYYAIRKGRQTGIFDYWNECKKYVIGFKGAEYKSFDKLEDAERFLASEIIIYDESVIDTFPAYAFVDGSFNEKTNSYGYGGFIVYKDDSSNSNKIILSGSENNEDLASMRNIAGELLGSIEAIKTAIHHEIKDLYIIYDYAGIEMWAKGLWSRNKEGTKQYYEFIKSIENKINLHFIKVKGHNGIPGNEIADRLAKESVGIIEPKNFILKNEYLDCKICDIETESDNDKTYREYLEELIDEYDMSYINDLDEMNDEELTDLLNLLNMLKSN